MSFSAFISYSHRDEKALDRLHAHLAMLKREEVLTVWYDRNIEAGKNIDVEIQSGFESSSLFLALVSPDFLASDYCYEREMESALQRHTAGTMRVVPIILEPCDWKSSPLAQFKAVPKDGQPISLWTNNNVAWLDVITELRRVLSTLTSSRIEPAEKGSKHTATTAPRIRIKRDFDSIDRADFRDSTYETIRSFFQSSIDELNRIGDPIRARYEMMGPTSFTCTVVNKAKASGESHITVHNQKNRGLGDLTYMYTPHAPANSANGVILVGVDEYQMFLRMDAMSPIGRDRERKLTAEQVASLMWTNFLERAGIDYA